MTVYYWADVLYSFLVPVRRDEVTEWATQESEWTDEAHTSPEPSLWSHAYVIYLKMYYDIRTKWEAESDPLKLQQLFRHMNKYVK